VPAVPGCVAPPTPPCAACLCAARPAEAAPGPAGTNELDQVGRILDVLGAPPPALLAAFARRSQHAVGLRLAPRRGSGLAALAPRLAPAGLDLLGRLLSYDPAARPSAEQALRHPYFRALRRAPALRPSPPRGRARARPGVQRPGAACLATLMAASQTQHARQARSSAPGWRRTAAPERRAASRLRAHAE